MIRPGEARNPHRRVHRALVVLLALAFVLLGATNAFAITRDTVLERAQRRVDRTVPYSQTKYYAGYRTDCSGYVSMCWATGTSWNTRTFYKVTHRIPVSDLRPGDALLKKGYHIRLFYGWLDEAHTSYIAYESASGRIAGVRIHSIADDLGYGYVPVRYDRIRSSPKPSNVLQNPRFDTWARSWSGAAEQPMWWQASGDWRQTLTMRRKSVYRTARNSLQLFNPAGDPESYTELSQAVPIVPGSKYRLNGWARSAFDPSGLEMGLMYLDAWGDQVGESHTTGDAWGVNGASFKMMSVILTAPPTAVSARVTVRLAGGSVETSGGPVPGTSAILDDMSLARPQVIVRARANRTAAYRGTTVYLSGTVAPRSAVGRPAIIYVRKPGSSWQKLATTTVRASGNAGVWKGKYTFTRGMRRGTYQFRTYVPRIPEYLGATSSAVSVKLR